MTLNATQFMKAAAVLCASLVCSQATIARDYANWMAELPDGAFLYTLSIPGSHDTMTGEGFITASDAYHSQTQTVSLENQIEKGIRALDLRTGIRNNKLWCFHGTDATKKSFDDAFTTLCNFLDRHPSEFFIIHLLPGKKGLLSDYTIDEFKPYLNALVSDSRFKNYIIPFTPSLQMAHLRGKIVLLPRYDFVNWDNEMNSVILHNWNATDEETGEYVYPNSKTAVSYSGEYKEYMIGVQDLANTNGSNLDKKVKSMKALVDYSTSKKYIPNRTNITWAINFLSAYTDDGISHADGYAENAERCNKEFIDYISRAEYTPGPLGIILADFVGAREHSYCNNATATTTKTRTTYGDELITKIIDNNFNYSEIFPQVAAPLFRKVNNSIFQTGNWLGHVEWADPYGNGYLDLIHRHRKNSLDYTLYKNENGVLTTANALLQPDDAGWNRVVIPVDYNRDGNLDFIYGASWNGQVMKNTGNCNLVTTGLNFYNQDINLDGDKLEKRYQGIELVADLDHDGYPEVIVFRRDNEYPTVFKNQNGTFYGTESGEGENAQRLIVADLKDGTMALGDFNRDGKSDIVVTGMGADGKRHIAIAFNTTTEQYNYKFDTQILTDLDSYATINGIIGAADLNNDGWLDLVVTGETSSSDKSLAILFNKGNNTFRAADVTTNNLPAMTKGGIDLIDINSDGYVDILFSGEANRSDHNWAATGIMINQQDETFVGCDLDFLQLRSGATIKAADYKKNGLPSIAVMGYGTDCFGLYDQVANTATSTARKAPSRVNFADGADEISFKSNPYQKLDCTKTDLNDNQVKLSWESLGDEYSYNYIVKLKDGSMVYAVPAVTSESSDVTAGPRALLTGTTDQAIRSTSVTLNVKPSDVKAWGVHAIAPDRTTSLIYLDSNDVVTGIDGINLDENDADAPVEFYNLQGQRVVNPSNGIYIRRQGSNVTKVRI